MGDFGGSRVPLPLSVENLLQQISNERSVSPADAAARKRLVAIGEEKSLYVLSQIRSSSNRIYNLSGFIVFMANKVADSPISTPAPSEESCCFSPSKYPCTPPPAASTSTSSSPPSRDDPSICSPTPDHLVRSSLWNSESSNDANGQQFSSQLVALGELEFRKAFIILTYIGKKRIEDAISAGRILAWKHLPMRIFELEVWKALGKKHVEEEDRLRSLDWDSGKAHYYHCHVNPDGSYTFKGPYLNKVRTHLQRVLGDDNVLNVKFSEEQADQSNAVAGSNDSRIEYKRIAKEGILVGLRRYEFFVFKDGGKEEKKKNPTSSPVKCFFVRTESKAASDLNDSYILSKKAVCEARCLFMHVHTTSSVPKYMARFSLILSKTMKLDVDLSDVVETIDDVLCRDDNGCLVYDKDGEALMHTDGTGFISEDLALKCPLNVFKGTCFNNENTKRLLDITKLEDKFSKVRLAESNIREPPLLIQFRMFYNGLAAKGTLLVNRKLASKTIQIRPSMIKVEADANLPNIKTINSLEIVGTSNKPKKSNLSKYLIVLLSYGGVPDAYFLSILKNAWEEAQSIYVSKRAALRVSLQYADMDDFTPAKMICSGIPLHEPYLQYRLSILLKEVRKGLKEGKIPLSECFYLMGTVDPTGTLKRDEVCIILDNGQISGKVLVFKHPGLHFGDIHVLNATYIRALEDVVGNAKYAIFFPTKGPRSLADEMANSDFDGDMYWVSRNPQLLKYFKASEPWTPSYSSKIVAQKRPCEYPPEELEHLLFQLFLTTRFHPSSVVGMAAESWLAFMDRLLTLEDDCAEERECLKRKVIQLVDIYYSALDAPKSGMKVTVPKELLSENFPHFMGKRNSYKSTSILGEMYDKVGDFEREMEAAKDVEVWTLPCFDGEVPRLYLEKWEEFYKQYRSEMAKALESHGDMKNKLADEVIKKYKQAIHRLTPFETPPFLLYLITNAPSLIIRRKFKPLALPSTEDQ